MLFLSDNLNLHNQNILTLKELGLLYTKKSCCIMEWIRIPKVGISNAK